MEIYKFGGASVKNAGAIDQVVKIFKRARESQLLIVVSAMGKTTNLLEEILALAIKAGYAPDRLSEVSRYHFSIVDELFESDSANVSKQLNQLFEQLQNELKKASRAKDYDRYYPRIVCFGELASSTILSAHLAQSGIKNRWIDARDYVHTDSNPLEGKVDWKKTQTRIRSSLPRILKSQTVITQGFIGRDSKGNTTTLGREGSDFTAAIFGACLRATGVTVWKDVDGIRNADPRYYHPTVKYPRLSYQEAAEMTYYGAKVIHPRTIQPLALAGIPLYVRSFNEITKKGTVIDKRDHGRLKPNIIFKFKQCLISFRVRDYAFVNEKHLSLIFHQLDQLGLTVNLMQNSAISFSVCLDNKRPARIKELIRSMKGTFSILYNDELDLITVKNYDNHTVDQLTQGRTVLLEQRSRHNYQIVVPANQLTLPMRND